MTAHPDVSHLPWPSEVSTAAREIARSLVREIEERAPSVLELDRIDLGPALEQAVFGYLRHPAGAKPPQAISSTVPWNLARIGRAALTTRPPARYLAGGGPVVVLLNPAHRRILAAVEVELGRVGVPPPLRLAESHATSRGRRQPPFEWTAWLDLEWTRHLARHQLAMQRGSNRMEPLWPKFAARRSSAELRRFVSAALSRIAGDAARFASVAKRQPGVIATFDEIGRWGRIIPAAARRYAVPSLDIAHAEAVDSVAIEGAAYDRYAVFGPRAASVLCTAGIDGAKVFTTGAPAFDALLRRERKTRAQPPRIVFASQWLGGQMTRDVKRQTIRIALEAAATLSPCLFIARPHPIEKDDVLKDVFAAGVLDGVSASIDRTADLHDLLDGATVLLTGWSNSIYESLLLRVPAVCINSTGGPLPTSFGREKLALEARTATEAQEAMRLVVAEDQREIVLARAWQALPEHLGPLDGRAATRVAEALAGLTRTG